MTEAKDATFKIGTRESKLALWQAYKVRDLLTEAFADLNIEIVGMTTQGDKNQKDPLSSFSDKGIFTKELDVALLNGSIHIAVHSMKDLPTELPKGLAIGAMCVRGTVEDALVLKAGSGIEPSLDKLPEGSRLGTSSVRRRAILAKRYPKLECIEVRGNLNTRLAKLDAEDGPYTGLLLARAGLQRLEFDDRISQVLDFPHAVAQGALAVVCREDDKATLETLKKIEHTQTLLECSAERSLLKTLEGGCKVPIAVQLKWNGDSLTLFGAVFDPTAAVESVDFTASASVKSAADSEKLGKAVAQGLLDKGAKEILDRVKGKVASEPNAKDARQEFWKEEK